ncbi:MAG: hypothetical protein HYV16_06775 [Gammaproteobacteria bacterium]|nr:hypothetical protein [Gammaproteobacteria bacterium]
MRPLLLSIALLLPLAASAEETQTEILPKKIAEECFKLKAGDKVSFGFKAGSDLEFNVHYHEGEAVKFPIEPSAKAAIENGEFSAPIAQTYCLMWKNTGDKAVTLSYWSKPQ